VGGFSPAESCPTGVNPADATVLPEGVMDSPPTRPETEEDKKLVEQSRKWVAQRVKYIDELEAERKELLAELAKTGGVPEPAGLGPDAGVEDWKELEKRLERRERLLWDEIKWLRQELAKRKKDRK
jgi:hypothetical protein